MVETALDFLNAADTPSLPVAVQAELLRAWACIEAKGAAAHAGMVGAFLANDGPQADGQRSAGAWLTWFTRCTPAAGRGQVAGAQRFGRHPHVHEALASGAVTVSYGRWIAEATEKFPAEDRDAVERILVEAAVSGAMIDDLITIATAALRRLRPGGLEDEQERRDAERSVTVSKTLGGVGRINGDLTAEATALTETVIESLAVKAGPADTRTKAQRRHDALAEAMRRLVESGLLPERGGSKPQIKVDVDLATLRSLPGSARAEQEWIEHAAAELARDRLGDDRTTRDLLLDRAPGGHPSEPAASPSGTEPSSPRCGGPAGAAEGPGRPPPPDSGGGALLEGVGPIGAGLAGALACDSVITPTVTGNIDFQALREMAAEWVAFHLPVCAERLTREDPPAGGNRGECCSRCADAPATDAANRASERLPSEEDLIRLQRSMLRWAIKVLSGPGGLASYLRSGLLERPLDGPSIVLDAGAGDRTVPAALERLVRRRDGGCRFPGCDHPAALSHVHHIVPRSREGPTALWNLLTLCSFHHLIAVHTWGWDIRLNPDGTTTATAPDGRELGEHQLPGSPPLRAA